MSLLLAIEILSVLFNLAYLFLVIKENIWCWPNGILASLLSVYLFIEYKLYSEAILYCFYVLAGIYGWLVWSRLFSSSKELKIKTWKIKPNLFAIIIGAIGTFGLGYFFANNSDAKKPYFDAFSTSFSFVATFMEAHKILSAWVYWIILNIFSVWLYYSRDLKIYASLMVVYSVASIWGYMEWKRKYYQAL